MDELLFLLFSIFLLDRWTGSHYNVSKGGIDMFYGIAVFPSTEIREFADLYRRRYDPHFPLLKPHLTLREKEAWDKPPASFRFRLAADTLALG